MTSTLAIIIMGVMLLNVMLVATMILIERKKPESISAWVIVLTIFPIFGFLFYALIGGGLSFKTKRMLRKKAIYNESYIEDLETQANQLYTNDESLFNNAAKKYKDLVLMNMKNAESVFSKNNSITYFYDGQKKFEELLKDIKKAKHHIHLLYFIFANDKTGKTLCKLLTEKAKEGVEVRLLYDSFGSLRTKPKMFKELLKAGGEIYEFFPPLFGVKLVNFKANYRNHRKIVVIDGKVGYTGGLNIRDDHMGRLKKLYPWRDAHIKLEGDAVHSLQNVFLSDWLHASEGYPDDSKFKTKKYFPKIAKKGEVGIQIVSSGPENKPQQIKECFIKMINSATKNIYIQTPYFVPDDAFMEALRIALLSDVEVNIMIPRKPDKKTVYYATLSHIQKVLDLGAKVHLYNGFLHAKTITIDDEIASMGTCNMDIRSFMLNFEVNSVIYSASYTKDMNKMYIKDVGNSEQMSYNYFRDLSKFKKFLISIFRLFSPLM